MVTVAELDGVSVRRGTKLLLDAVNVKVSESERWVIVGPNGAGKTTMLSLLATQMHPTSGVVSLLGEYLGAVDVFELRPRIGLASSAMAHRIPPAEKVVDIVMSASYGVVGRWRETYDELDVNRARELMAIMQVDELAERTYGTLSEGERKRVEIARALMTDPELLLLDEPSAGLDLRGREVLIGVLGQLCADPYAPTMIMVTHHLEEIPPGITHALLLDDGRVHAQGPISEVLTAENLTAVYGIGLDVVHDEGRWSARAVHIPRRAQI